MSDGSDELRFLDPVTFAEKRRLKVTGSRRTAAQPQRARVREGRDLRERLADRLRRPDSRPTPARSAPTSTCAACWRRPSAPTPTCSTASPTTPSTIASSSPAKWWPKLFEITLVKKGRVGQVGRALSTEARANAAGAKVDGSDGSGKSDVFEDNARVGASAVLAHDPRGRAAGLSQSGVPGSPPPRVPVVRYTS